MTEPLERGIAGLGATISRIFGERLGTVRRVAIIVIFGVVTASDQTRTQPRPYTAEQADAGRAVYLVALRELPSARSYGKQ